MYKHFEKNQAGRDFVVGDIHGMFSLLQEELDKIGFNEETDRLFSVGDLVDRGAESGDVIDWLDKSFFHPVAGNHEQMVLDAHASPERCLFQLLRNGGGWWVHVPNAKQNVIACMFAQLPLAISVETEGGLVGIVHAEVPENDWDVIREAKRLDGWKATLQWSRKRISSNNEAIVKGVDVVYVGHTPLDEKTTLGNVVYIDTGACFGDGKLTIVEI